MSSLPRKLLSSLTRQSPKSIYFLNSFWWNTKEEHNKDSIFNSKRSFCSLTPFIFVRHSSIRTRKGIAVVVTKAIREIHDVHQQQQHCILGAFKSLFFAPFSAFTTMHNKTVILIFFFSFSVLSLQASRVESERETMKFWFMLDTCLWVIVRKKSCRDCFYREFRRSSTVLLRFRIWQIAFDSIHHTHDYTFMSIAMLNRSIVNKCNESLKSIWLFRVFFPRLSLAQHSSRKYICLVPLMDNFFIIFHFHVLFQLFTFCFSCCFSTCTSISLSFCCLIEK